MAKARMIDEDSPLKRTTPESADSAAPVVPAEGYTRTVGVSLKESELAMLGDMAQRLGVSRNKLTRWVIRFGLGEILAGRVNPADSVVETKQANLDMP